MGSIEEPIPERHDAQSLIQQLHDLSLPLAKSNENARVEAIQLCRQLTSTLTNPTDKAMEIIFTPFLASAVQTAVKMNLFDALVQHAGSATTERLASSCAAEPLLVNRILRLVASMDFVTQASINTWTANETTHAMAIPAIAAGHRFVWDIQVEGVIKGPQWLEENHFTCPTNPKDGFIQYAKQTQYDIFEYMANERPDRLRDFHLFMENTMGSRTYWIDWFPIEERILEGYDGATPLIVDVGGGKGHDILAFASKYPRTTPGQLILQDIAPALATIPESNRSSRITYQPQNFFEPNAVKGARVYFMHHILHDWSDQYALQILNHIRRVMKPGYSKLLIHDLILPDQGVSQYQAAYDMVMMTFNSGGERSESQWRELVARAGLRVAGVWFGEGGRDADGIVEVVLEN